MATRKHGLLAAASRRRIANPPQINNLPHKQSARVARVHTGEELGWFRRRFVAN